MADEANLLPGRRGMMLESAPCCLCDLTVASEHPVVCCEDTAGGHHHFHPPCYERLVAETEAAT